MSHDFNWNNWNNWNRNTFFSFLVIAIPEILFTFAGKYSQ